MDVCIFNVKKFEILINVSGLTNIFIKAADAAIKNYVGYELNYATGIVETFDGNNQEEIYTNVAPIVSVTSVVEDAVTLTEGNQEHYVVYKQLGKIKKTPSSPDDFELDSVTNPHPKSDYVVRLTAPEFTSICPVTGQPDFGIIIIDYVPNKLIVESKSFKLFFRKTPKGVFFL